MRLPCARSLIAGSHNSHLLQLHLDGNGVHGSGGTNSKFGRGGGDGDKSGGCGGGGSAAAGVSVESKCCRGSIEVRALLASKDG